MLIKVFYRVKSIVMRIIKIFGFSTVKVVRFNYDDWLKRAQKGEFQFHLRDEWRQTEDFMDQTIKLFDHFGFERNQYDNKTIIDLGAGSKLRSKYFLGAKIIAIEPLAEKFLRDITWCDLNDANELYSVPAENLIEQCYNLADLLISINVLDHCYDFEQIIKNIVSYLKDDGIAFLSFDKHEFVDDMHPLQLDEEACEEIFKAAGLNIDFFSKGANDILKTYGHGPYCMNYTLSRVK